MNGLDEALAVNYLSDGFLTAVNNVWAWIAVITAAFSLWSIKTLSSQLVLRPEQRRSHNAASTSTSPPKVAAAAAKAKAAESSVVSNHCEPVNLLSTSATTAGFVIENESSPKGKFSLYYNEDDLRGRDNGGGDGGGQGGAVVNEKLGWWCDDWEKMRIVRMGDMGWYRLQDMKVLDGNVVRLWEDRGSRDALFYVTATA